MSMVNPYAVTSFSFTELTAAVNKIKYTPRRLASFFNEQGIATTTAIVEDRAGILTLLPVKARGGPGSTQGVETRKMYPFSIPHIPVISGILADSIQGIRSFGSDSQSEVLQTRVMDEIKQMIDSIEFTIESHRMKALGGLYVDANGADTSLWTMFGVVQVSQALGLSTTLNSGIRGKMFTALKAATTALDGVPFGMPTVLCSDGFWSALLEDKDTKSYYLSQVQAAELRGTPSESFTAFGVSWEWYRGVGTVVIPADAAYMIPAGVNDLCITRYAPANYAETINTIGLPYYAKTEPMPFGKGYSVEVQSNPLNIVTRPDAIIKLTKA